MQTPTPGTTTTGTTAATGTTTVPGAPGTTTVPLTTDPTATAPAGTASEQSVVAEARKYLGIPYVWGGTDPKTGLDCSGLVQLVYKNLGVDLPRVSYQQATEGRAVPNMAQARPGDLLAFGSPSVNHIAIYIGGGKMIHAPRPGEQVEVSDVYATPVAIRRVLPESASTARVAAPGGVAGGRRARDAGPVLGPLPGRRGQVRRAGHPARGRGQAGVRLQPRRGQPGRGPWPHADHAGDGRRASASTRCSPPRPSTAPHGCCAT